MTAAVTIISCFSFWSSYQGIHPKRMGGTNIRTDERYWMSCVPRSETIPGKNDLLCTEDMRRQGYHGSWLHVSEAKAGCPRGFGKGICTPAKIPFYNMSFYEQEAREIFEQSKDSQLEIDEEMMNHVFRGKLAQYDKLLHRLHGTVDIIEVKDDLLEKLAQCMF